MNGAHDLGGMHSFGPVPDISDAEVFHDSWEGRVYAVHTALGWLGLWNSHVSRALGENVPPEEYLTTSYYERWLNRTEKMVTMYGLVTAEELTDGKVRTPPRSLREALRPDEVASSLERRPSTQREPLSPAAFAPGDRIRFRNINPRGHTRLPRYARGQLGTVESVRGYIIFPDSSAFGNDEAQWSYAVRLRMADIDENANTKDSIIIDTFEPYLEKIYE